MGCPQREELQLLHFKVLGTFPKPSAYFVLHMYQSKDWATTSLSHRGKHGAQGELEKLT